MRLIGGSPNRSSVSGTFEQPEHDLATIRHAGCLSAAFRCPNLPQRSASIPPLRLPPRSRDGVLPSRKGVREGLLRKTRGQRPCRLFGGTAPDQSQATPPRLLLNRRRRSREKKHQWLASGHGAPSPGCGSGVQRRRSRDPRIRSWKCHLRRPLHRETLLSDACVAATNAPSVGAGASLITRGVPRTVYNSGLAASSQLWRPYGGKVSLRSAVVT